MRKYINSWTKSKITTNSKKLDPVLYKKYTDTHN